MNNFKNPSVITLHALALFGSLSLAVLSGQNPRVILYAIIIGLVWRFLTAWLLTIVIDSFPALVRVVSRKPFPYEKLRRARNPHTGKVSRGGFFAYLFGILTMTFMIGIFQFMAHGPVFLTSNVLVPEVTWGTGISVLYWIEDIVTKSIIIHPEKDVSDNLAYNAGGYKFLLATIFLSQVVILTVMFILLLLEDLGLAGQIKHGTIPVEWIIISILALLKFSYEIRLPKKPRRLPG